MCPVNDDAFHQGFVCSYAEVEERKATEKNCMFNRGKLQFLLISYFELTRSKYCVK